MSKVSYFFRKQLYYFLTNLHFKVLETADYISTTWDKKSPLTNLASKVGSKKIVLDYDTEFCLNTLDNHEQP